MPQMLEEPAAHCNGAETEQKNVMNWEYGFRRLKGFSPLKKLNGGYAFVADTDGDACHGKSVMLKKENRYGLCEQMEE